MADKDKKRKRDKKRKKPKVKSPEQVAEELGIAGLEEHELFLNIGIYGGAGIGKTRLAGSINQIKDPRLRKLWLPALMVDIEHGTWSIRDRTDIDRTSKGDYKSLRKIVRYIRSGRLKYKTVILDSWTDIQRQLMHDIIEAEGRETMEIQDWGTLLEQQRNLVSDFRDLPVNLIVTALAREHTDDEDEEPSKMKPALQGGFREELPAYLDVVGYYFMGRPELDDDDDEEDDDKETKRKRRRRRRRQKPVRMLQVEPTSRVEAKDRSDVLGGVVVAPTMDSIVTTIMENRDFLDSLEDEED